MGALRPRLRGARALAILATCAGTGCWPSQWLLRGDASGADAVLDGADAGLVDVASEPAIDATVVDAIDASEAVDASEVVDIAQSEPSIDVPPADDADVAVDARDATIDAVEASAGGYRLDTSDVQTSERAGGARIPSMLSGDQRAFECVGGATGANILGGFSAEAPSDPSSQAYINRVRFICERLARTGVVGAPVQPMAGYINNSPRVVGEPTGAQLCPAGFIFVGVQGETTYDAFSGEYFISRMGLVCARIEAWRTNPDLFPTISSDFFRGAYASAADAGADASVDAAPDADPDAGAVDGAATEAGTDAGDATAEAPFGSDTLPRLVGCTDVPAIAQACARPIYGGRPTADITDPRFHQRPYFVACSGGYAPVGLAGTAGYFVGAVEFHCARIVLDP